MVLGVTTPAGVGSQAPLDSPLTHLFNVGVQRLAQFGGQSVEFDWLLGV